METSHPHRIGKYDVIELLGRGGMGVVYKAVDPAIGRLVAVKMMTPTFGADAELLKRFYREAQSAGKLQHPNILTVYDLGDLSGNPYLVMEFIEGESLDRIISSRRDMLLDEKLSLMIQVCHGLHYAHERNVVHRDIKPGNIMVDKGGTVKIVDFGLAHIGTDNLTLPGQVMGSINYMSPEQINGQAVDLRTDIFATGVVLYQLLTYALPFQGKDTGSTLLKIIHEPPLPLEKFLKVYPPELESVIQRVLAKDRDERYPNAEELAVDLTQIREQLRRERIEQCLQSVEALLAASELEEAQEQLSRVLKIDRQHPRANELMREVRQLIQKRVAKKRAQELRCQAEEALRQQNFDDALVRLGEAVKLDESNTDLLHLRNFVQGTKARAEQVREALQQAESAQAAGELEEARKAVEAALTLDPHRPEAKAMLTTIENAIAEREKRKQFQASIEEARKQIAAREFEQALVTLKKAEATDATDPVLSELNRLVTAGVEQERRRREIETLTSEIEDALNRDDYNTACAKADEGLRRLGDDRRLQQLRALAQKQREAGERRAYISEQISTSRKLVESGRTAEALTVVEKACGIYPAEPALQSMLAMVKETLAREEAERQKAECTQKAKELLRRKQYSDAIQLLESARERLKTADFDDFVQYVRDEAANHARQQRVAAVVQEANQLITAEEYEEAVELLQATLAELPDDELQIILNDAERHIAEFTRSVTEAVTAAQRLIVQHRASEAVRLLESQPKSFMKSTDFRATIEQAREALHRMRVIADAKEHVREALGNEDFDRAAGIVADLRHELGDLQDIVLLDGEISFKRNETFTRRVESAVRDARTLLIGRSHRSALEILDSVFDYVDTVSAELRMRYHSLRTHALSGIVRQETESERRPKPVGSEKDFVPSSGPTLPQTQWPMAGAATPVMPPPHEPPVPVDQVREVNIIGQGDSSTFHNGLGHVISIVPPELEATEVARPSEPTQPTEAPVAEELYSSELPAADAAAVDQISSEVSEPTPLEETRVEPFPPSGEAEPAPTELVSPPRAAPEAAAILTQDTQLAQPGAQAVEPGEPAATQRVYSAAPDVQETVFVPEPELAESAATPVEVPVSVPVTKLPRPPREGVVPEAPGPGAPKRGLPRGRITLVAAAIVMVAVFVGLWRLVSKTAPGAVSVPVVVSPEGATVRIDNKDACVTPNCQIELAAGNHQIQVGKLGYETLSQNFTVPSPTPIHLSLKPLKQSLQVSTNFQGGKVWLDRNQVGGLQDGQFLMEALSDGTHVLGVVGPDAEASVTFEVSPGLAPSIKTPPESKQARALVVSSLGRGVHVACNCTEAVTLDGKVVGSTAPGGLDLDALSSGRHVLKVGEGSNQHVVTISTLPVPVLEVFLASARNVGTLVVETKEDGVDVLLNGRKYDRTTAHGLLRIPLDTRNYVVQVHKKGYRPPPSQQAEIRRNEDTKLVFNLEPEPAVLLIRGAPSSAQIKIDDTPIGVVGANGVFSAKLSPGEHLIEVTKSGYSARRLRKQLNPGETLALSRSEVTLEQVPAPRTPETLTPETRRAEAVTTPPVPVVNAAAQDWERISSSKDPMVFDTFRKKYPDSPFAEQAAKRIEQLEWDDVKSSRDAASLQAFLRKYPNGSYSQAARSALASLESAQAGAERRAILDVLQRYAAAYEHKDANEVAAVWPTLGKQDSKKIKDSFKNAATVHMELRPAGDLQIAGDRATVTCTRLLQYTFKDGAPSPQQDTITVELRKRGGFWVMDSVH